MMGSGVSRCDQRGGTKWESIRLNVDQHKVSLEHLKRQSESAVCAEKPCNFTSFNANDKSTADIRAVPQALQTSTPTTDAKLSPARCSLKLNIARQQKESTVLQRSLNCTGTRFESMVDPLYLHNAAVLSSEHKSNYSFSTDCNHNSKHNSHSDVSDSKSSICSSSRVIYCTIGSILGPDDDKSDAKYIKKQLIGKGAFGEAYIVERNARYNVARHAAISEQCQVNTSTRPTIVGNRYVAKVIDLNNMPSQHRQYAQTEIICLAQVHHFAIVGYYEHYILDSEEDTIIIITEFADHGDLHHNLTQPTNACCPAPYIDKTSGRLVQGFRRLQLTEREAGIYFIQLLMALHYIHSHRMIHRDVKSANLFLTSRGLMKLGDFGFSQCYESTVSSESVAGTFLGTPYYLSPEMWSGTRYGKKADVWAAGIVLYEMLMDGARPFRAESLPELRRNVESNKVTLPECPPPLSDPVLWKRDDLVSHPPSHDTGNNATTNNTMNSNDGKTGNSSDETNARIRANTDWAVNSGDGGGSTISADVSSDGANALPRPRRVTNRARKFSEEMREFVSSIFERDPSCRPNTIKLLRTPIMQYYLHLFEKHIHSLIEADEQKLMQCKSFESATSGVQACGVGLHGSITDAAAAGLNFPCSSEKDLILSDINEVKLAVAHEMTKDLSAGIAQCYEGVVYKQNHNGEWKERYLALTDGALIISLVSGRQAIRGTERSRKVPLSMINAVSPCDPVGSIVRVCQHSTTISRAPSQQSAAAIEDKAMRSSVSSVPALAFAISMHSENSIVFGVSSVVELDCWLSTLLLALNME